MASLTANVRVATWNVHEGVPASAAGSWHKGADWLDVDQHATIDEAVRLVDRLSLDVVALQETPFDKDGYSRMLEVIRKRTDLTFVSAFPLSPSSFFKTARAGVAIVSRFPLQDERCSMLPNPGLSARYADRSITSHDKGMVAASFELAGRSVGIASVHMLPFHAFKRAASDRSFRDIWLALDFELSKIAKRPLIVGGDFNTDDRRLIPDDNLALWSAMAGKATYRDESLDDILFTDGFVLRQAGVHSNFSDHRLCVADLYTTWGTAE